MLREARAHVVDLAVKLLDLAALAKPACAGLT
jgi:hypothetical protein